MLKQKTKVVILGAGIQGCCTALELAKRGVKVTLIDRDEVPMNRASLRNEGKIHLGLVYANDPTFATAKLQLQGALNFRNLLLRWIGFAADRLRHSSPFYYIVAKDSFFTPEQLSQHYSKLESIYQQAITDNPSLNYLATKPERLFCKVPQAELEKYFRVEELIGGFKTVELAIDTNELAIHLRQAIQTSSNINFLPSRRVKTVERLDKGLLRIEGTATEGTWQIDSEQVVNATWESRLAIDDTLGLDLPNGWVHRLKYRVIVKIPDSLHNAPSATMVIGRYGDVVIRADGTAYLSWYPVGLRGWTHFLQPPESWNASCRGEVEPEEAQELATITLKKIDNWFPGIQQSETILVDAGVIVAYGKTDVDDAKSGLHERTQAGVTSVDGYHSLDAGKLTTAPLFAMVAADRVMAGYQSPQHLDLNPTALILSEYK